MMLVTNEPKSIGKTCLQHVNVFISIYSGLVVLDYLADAQLRASSLLPFSQRVRAVFNTICVSCMHYGAVHRSCNNLLHTFSQDTAQCFEFLKCRLSEMQVTVHR